MLDREYVEPDYERVCEILEIWYEYDYDTWLMVKDGAFPLLKRLYIAGDPIAEKVFKKEIKKRLEKGLSDIVAYLIGEGYTDYLETVVISKLRQNIKEVDNAFQIKDFLSRFNLVLKSEELWKDFPNLFVDMVEINREFVNLMELKPCNEGGLFFEFLLMLNSEEKIQKLSDMSEEKLLQILYNILENMKVRQESENVIKDEFTINKYLTLKLIEDKTMIYVNDKLFLQCQYLLLNIPEEDIEKYDFIQSIDEAAIHLDSSLENPYLKSTKISPETEFFGHCSNLQVWAENNYNTQLLHRNIAFNLLKKLTIAGDRKAKRVFKEEIAKRVLEGYPTVVSYLLHQGYLQYLDNEELETLVDSTSDIFVKSQIALHFAYCDNIIKALEIYNNVKLNREFRDHNLKLFAEMWERVAEYYLGKEAYYSLVIASEHVVKCDPDYRSGWENLGHAYRNANDFEKAIIYYKKAIEKNPENHVYSSLAFTYKEIGMIDQAELHATKALRINPKDVVGKNVLEEILNERMEEDNEDWSKF